MVKCQKFRDQGRRWPSVSLNGVLCLNSDALALGWVEVQGERGMYELLFSLLWPDVWEKAWPQRKGLSGFMLWGWGPSLGKVRRWEHLSAMVAATWSCLLTSGWVSKWDWDKNLPVWLLTRDLLSYADTISQWLSNLEDRIKCLNTRACGRTLPSQLC